MTTTDNQHNDQVAIQLDLIKEEITTQFAALGKRESKQKFAKMNRLGIPSKLMPKTTFEEQDPFQMAIGS
jgi:hypothetical protein